MSATPATDGRAGIASDGRCRLFRFRFLRRRLLLLLILLGLAAGGGFALRPQVRAWYHRRAARLESQRYHNAQAVQHLLICRDIWPRDPETLLLFARAARRDRVYGDSESLLRLYREVRGRDDAYTFEQILLAAECRVDEVSERCWKFLEEGRYDAPLLLEALTRGYLQQYRLDFARFCLDRWKKEQPDNPQVFYLEGLLNLEYHHALSTALVSYRRALELDPDHEEARLGLAVALEGNNDFAEAAEHFRRLLQIRPHNLHVQVHLAACLLGLGESVEAARRVEDVLARQPEFTPALLLRGQRALKDGYLEEAETCLRQVLRHDPKDHRARYNLILCLERSGREEEARQQQQQLDQIDQDLERFHELVTKEIAQRPTDPAVHCSIGQILLRSGERDEGIRWLHSALKLDPHYAPARQLLAEHLSRDR